MRQESTLKFRTMRVGDAPVEDDGDDEIDLRAIISKLWRGRWIIFISTLFAGLIGFFLTSQYEATYTARTKVMFDINQANVVDVGQSVVRIDDTLENQVEILQSTTLIERVVAELNLLENPAFNSSLRPPRETLGTRIRGIFSIPDGVKEVLRDVGLMSPPPAPPDAAEAAALLRLQIISRIRGSLKLSPIWDTKVIELAYTAGDRNLAARVANTFAQQYITDQLEAKLEATREATTWLSNRVEELRQRVQDAEEAVEAARVELASDAGQSLEITQAQIQAQNASISVARNDLSLAQATYGRLRDAVDTGRDFGALNEFRASPLIQTYRASEDALTSQQTALGNTVGEDHPARVRLAQQLSEVRENLQREAERIVEGARVEVAVQTDRVANLEAELDELEALAQGQSQDTIRIRQLEREAEASRALYENFLGRLKETAEQEALQTADARILSPAEVPLGPDAARARRTQLLSLILGAMAGVGLIFLIDLLNNTFRAPDQLEQLTGLPYLGALPSAGRRLHRRDVVTQFKTAPKSALAEAVRSLRTSILFSKVDEPPRTVMFTSSVPREGKSTTSMLVAMTSRQMGKSAVIIDCDLRLPSLARLLPDEGREQGLLSVLDGTATIDEAVYHDEETGLDVLMTVPSEPRSNINAADILSSRKFHEIVAELKARYDLVIFDTPPSLVVADAKILSRLVDAVVYVVRWDSTPRGAVQEGIKELQSVGAPLIGVSFTMLNEARAARYSYDGYSYYRGRYKDYYVS